MEEKLDESRCVPELSPRDKVVVSDGKFKGETEGGH